MKTLTLVVALAALTAVSTSARASEKTNSTNATKGLVKREKPSPGSGLQEKNVALTGSYIKRNVRRQGVITDGPNPLYVVDRKTIELSGAADLSQVLLRTGFRR